MLGLNSRVLHTNVSGTSGLVLSRHLAKLPIDPPTSGKWGFDAHWTSPQGIEWANRAELPVRAKRDAVLIPHSHVFSITLERGRVSLPHLNVLPSASANLAAVAGGNLVLEDLDEMLSAARASLPSGALALAGKALGGFLRIKGQRAGWWRRTDFDHLTMGPLLDQGPVVKAIRRHMGTGYLQILKGSAVSTRNPGVHNNQASVTLAQAIGSAEVVLQVVNSWH